MILFLETLSFIESLIAAFVFGYFIGKGKGTH